LILITTESLVRHLHTTLEPSIAAMKTAKTHNSGLDRAAGVLPTAKSVALLGMAAIATLGSLACAAYAESNSIQELRATTKNLARHHNLAGLRWFDAARSEYVAALGAAAWLDDDIASGFPLLPGQQFYLLSLSEPAFVNALGFSAKEMEGTVSVWVGDDVREPGNPAWSPVLKGASFATLNDRQPGRKFGKYAKYILIETNVAAAQEVYSIGLYGDRTATTDSFVPRPAPLDAAAVLGQPVDVARSINVASLTAGARVSFVQSTASEKLVATPCHRRSSGNLRAGCWCLRCFPRGEPRN
jgi:hypothetical protein